MRLTRRQFSAGARRGRARARLPRPAAARARLTRCGRRPRRRASSTSYRGLRVVREQGVAVVVPPLHHRVVTARVAVPETPRRAPRGAALASSTRSHRVEARHPFSAAGLCVTVAWGLPYFRRYVPAPGRSARSRSTSARPRRRGREVRVVEDAPRFPSDPDEPLLEQNDVAVLLRSDSLDGDRRRRRSGCSTDSTGLLAVTSIRNGFVGGGLDGRTSLPKAMAHAGRDPWRAAASRARRSSSSASPRRRAHALGPGPHRELRDARLRDSSPIRTSRAAPHMHLSHLVRGRQRLVPELRPQRARRRDVPAGARASSRRGADRRPGHRAASRRAARCAPTTSGTAGSATPERSSPHRGSPPTSSARTAPAIAKAPPIPQRADFNTLDNPFAWSAAPARDRLSDEAVGRRALRRLQPDGRRLPPRPPRDGRRPPRRHPAPVRAARVRPGDQRACSTRPTGRTSSCRRERTARSRSPSAAS